MPIKILRLWPVVLLFSTFFVDGQQILVIYVYFMILLYLQVFFLQLSVTIQVYPLNRGSVCIICCQKDRLIFFSFFFQKFVTDQSIIVIRILSHSHRFETVTNSTVHSSDKLQLTAYNYMYIESHSAILDLFHDQHQQMRYKCRVIVRHYC